MKKILFATTALVATTGIAAADVAVSGAVEMGVVGGDRYGDTTQFWTEHEVTFTMSGEADNGLTFGAAVQLDEAAASGGTDDQGATVFVAYGPARLTMGDTDGAFDAALTEVAIGGSIDDSHTAHAGYNGNAGMDGTYDGQVATFSYSFDSFTGYISAEIDDSGTFDPVWGIGASYSADLGGLTLGVGIGYQSGDQANANAQIASAVGRVGALVQGVDLSTTPPTPIPGESNDAFFERSFGVWNATAGGIDKSEVIGLSLSTTFNNGLQAVLNYSEAKYADFAGFDETETHMALGLGYTMNALTIGFNYGVYDDRYGIDGLEQTGYGLAVNYDLGGGLAVQFGYGASETKATGVSFDSDSYSLGLAMSF